MEGPRVEVPEGVQLAVAGPLQGVWLLGKEQQPFILKKGTFVPQGELARRLLEPGEVVLVLLGTDNQTRNVVVARESTRLSLDELQALVTALGPLAQVLNGVQFAPGGSAPHARERELLLEHIPPLLRRPLRTLQVCTGAVASRRARPSPRALLQQQMEPERSYVLGVALAEGPDEADHAWLRSRIEAVVLACRTDEIEADHPDTETLEALLSHPSLAAGRAPPARPGWGLSRSVHGRALIAGLQDLEDETETSRGPGNLSRYPLADSATLYELWILLSVVQCLTETFGFVPSEPGEFADHFEHDRTGRKWRMIRPIRLQRALLGLNGTTQLLRAKVEYEPELRTRDHELRTPDVYLSVSGPAGETRHVLDAKFSKLRPTLHAVTVAHDRYLLDLRPHSSFVVLPMPEANFNLWFPRLEARCRSQGPGHYELTNPQGQGLAWGTLLARPGHGKPKGIEQFLHLALMVHRWEMRHRCCGCGHLLGRGDIVGVDVTGPEALSDREPVGADPKGLLRYACPRCAMAWRRWICRFGHVVVDIPGITPLFTAPGAKLPGCPACGHYPSTEHATRWGRPRTLPH